MTFGACTVHYICTIKDLVKQISGQCVIPAKKKGNGCVSHMLECFCKSLTDGRNDVMLIKSTFSPSVFLKSERRSDTICVCCPLVFTSIIAPLRIERIKPVYHLQ